MTLPIPLSPRKRFLYLKTINEESKKFAFAFNELLIAIELLYKKPSSPQVTEVFASLRKFFLCFDINEREH